MVTCTYFLDVLSQWCNIADLALEKVLARDGNIVDVHCVLAPMDVDVLPTREEQLRVFRRSRQITGVETQAWITESIAPNTWDANAVVLAAPYLDNELDIHVVRTRVARAALLEGRPLGNPGEAVAFVSTAFDLDAQRLAERTHSPEVTAQLEENRAAFKNQGFEVRPTFLLRNDIGDHIVLGGQYDVELLRLAIRSLQADSAGYEQFSALDAS